MKKRIEFRFSGRVQGVGFRYTACHLASLLGLTGWVYNDWDGSVVMQAQGEEENLMQMVERLENNDRFIQIEGIEKQELALEEHELSFEVKY